LSIACIVSRAAQAKGRERARERDGSKKAIAIVDV